MKTGKSTIKEKSFGLFKGEEIIEYTLCNSVGMQVSVINYGGAITKIVTADRDGNFENVTLGFNSLEGYLQDANPCMGNLIGPYANRIAKGKFKLSGIDYSLPANDRGNCLHGGPIGFHRALWYIVKADDNSLKLNFLHKDGEDGFPGNLAVEVIYRLTNDNSLEIHYKATTDKATHINLTSHCYFNLSGGKDSTVLNHQLTLNAGKYLPVNNVSIPTGEMIEVAGTPMDFKIPKTIGRDISQVAGGYDHTWVLEKKNGQLEKAAGVYEPSTGRFMEVFTTEPGLQFYCANSLDGTLKNTMGNQKYVQYAGLCLEAQHYPDSPNQTTFPNTILDAGEEYHQTTIYKFSIK